MRSPKNTSLASFLSRAVARFAQYKEPQALGELLQAWRRLRAPSLLEPISRLGARLDAEETRREGSGFPGQRRDWASTPTGLARTLMALEDSSPHVEEWVACVFRFDADPRFIPALLSVARLATARTPATLSKLCEALAYVGPGAQTEDLRALQARLGREDDSTRQLGALIEKWEQWTPAVPSDEALALREVLLRAVEERERSDAQGASARELLLPSVYAALEDDAARLVLADRLLEEGDPRGELIMLQCAPTPDEARVRELLGRHRELWEVPLGPLIEPRRSRFERGFPVAVMLRRYVCAVSEFPEPMEAWLTVREISWSGGHDATRFVEWLTHPHLRGVTWLRQLDTDVARAVAKRQLPVKGLELLTEGSRPPPLSSGEWEALARLPALTQVVLPEAGPEQVAACARSGMADRVERIEAFQEERWRLVVTPAEEVPVELILLGAPRLSEVARVVQVAAGFGARGIRIRSSLPPDSRSLTYLRAAASVHARVEWG
ncbi:TIGR02996 domain-containing protein [Myxococcus sp. K15C18031901]|uniref:TIGR02996 domain-containing protein n=1 Tax=Myxococcus dinghuensis TaxID=2906761 RepID=UPI0020A7DEF4|nr:TIGR02996 domain-containing protein [Myxococcus dinghuensis]MCP3099290.1 TIGR02996 domain-containing protein [Myxococcus dinghuensis]